MFEDRDRIARDLHDLVIQRLYATGMSLEGVSARLGDLDNRGRISSAVDALDETIKEIRSAIFSLHSRPAAVKPGLRARILEVVDEASGTLGFAPGLRMSGSLDGDVSAEAEDHLLGVLREALSNAARHARASKVDVTVEAGQELVVVVRDDGVGMDGSRRRSGLANLAERAGLLGRTLRTGPADGGGTELEWRVPLKRSKPGGRRAPRV